MVARQSRGADPPPRSPLRDRAVPSGTASPHQTLHRSSSTYATHPVPMAERRARRGQFDARMSLHLSADPRSSRYTGTSDQSFPSAAYRRLLAQLDRFARDASATILLEGESGTGKTTLARYVHGRSPRAARPFQQVVLSTIEDPLAGSE